MLRVGFGRVGFREGGVCASYCAKPMTISRTSSQPTLYHKARVQDAPEVMIGRSGVFTQLRSEVKDIKSHVMQGFRILFPFHISKSIHHSISSRFLASCEYASTSHCRTGNATFFSCSAFCAIALFFPVAAFSGAFRLPSPHDLQHTNRAFFHWRSIDGRLGDVVAKGEIHRVFVLCEPVGCYPVPVREPKRGRVCRTHSADCVGFVCSKTSGKLLFVDCRCPALPQKRGEERKKKKRQSDMQQSG